MKKRVFAIIFIILAAILLFAFNKVAYANSEEEKELTQNITDLLSELDLEELQKFLDENYNDFLQDFGNSAKEILEYIIYGNIEIDYSSYLNEFISVILSQATEQIPAIAQICAIIILCSITNSILSDNINGATKKVVKLACYAFIIIILTTILTGIITQCINCVKVIRRQIEIITPLLITLTVLTGGAGTASIYQPSAVFISNGVVQLISGFIFPATVGVIILNLISKLHPDVSFTGVSKLIKSIMKWVLGITVAIFGIFLTIQSATSSLFDGILFKATKYVVGNSVPIVGNFLSSGVDLFVSAGLLIKNSVGVFGIILLLLEVIQPIILLISFTLLLKGIGAVCQSLGEKTLNSLFSDLSSDIEYFLAGIFTVTFIYGLIIMIIVNSAVIFI